MQTGKTVPSDKTAQSEKTVPRGKGGHEALGPARPPLRSVPPRTVRTPPALSVLRWTLLVLTAAGLAIDAYVHLDLASTYDFVRSSTVTEGALFRAEAAVAIVAGLALLLRPRPATAAFATLVLAAGAAAILVYRYVDVPAFGPVPSMYEPIWYPEKTASAIAEVVATGTGLAALAVELRLRAMRRRSVAAH